MRFYKLISVLLHPIVLPTVGVILYFLLVPNKFSREQQLYVLAIIFSATYFIPLLLLILLKALHQIKTYQVTTIKERKLPVAFMVVLFYVLGNSLFTIAPIRDISLLFYATSYSLIVVYLSFILNLKISLHLLSMGISLGFFLVMSTMYSITFIPIILLLILLSGLLASARLYLKAHSPKEVYIGFFLGVIAPLLVNYFL